MLELTNHCNLHCTTCPREYAYGNQMDRGYMPPDKAKAIIDELSPYLDSIGLTGLGDTIVSPSGRSGPLHKTEKGKHRHFFSTNANMHGFIDKVKPVLPYIDTIQISVDGIGQTYEKIRHGARFQELDSNIRQLTGMTAGKGIDIMFNMVMTKESIHDMPGIVRYASENGIPFVNFSYFNLASVTRIPVSYYSLFDTPEFQSLRTETLHTAAILKKRRGNRPGKTPAAGILILPVSMDTFLHIMGRIHAPMLRKTVPKTAQLRQCIFRRRDAYPQQQRIPELPYAVAKQPDPSLLQQMQHYRNLKPHHIKTDKTFRPGRTMQMANRGGTF